MLHSIFEALPTDLVWAQILPWLPAKEFDQLCETTLFEKDFHFVYRFLIPAQEERRARGFAASPCLTSYILRVKPFSYIHQFYGPEDVDLQDIANWHILQAKNCMETWDYFTNADNVSSSSLYYLAIEHNSRTLVETIDERMDDWELEHLLTAIYQKRETIVDYMMNELAVYPECRAFLAKEWSRVFLGDTKSKNERFAILRVSLDMKLEDTWTWFILCALRKMLDIPDQVFYFPFMI